MGISKDMNGRSQSPFVSLIICTRDRADHLRVALKSISECLCNSSLLGEIIIVDNGSADGTRAVVDAAAMTAGAWEMRYLYEGSGGQAVARNTGLKSRNGNVIAFTDDDVKPRLGWLDELVSPILHGKADATLGCVELPSGLQKDWMTDLHRSWIASTCSIDFSRPERLVGANMAFHERVLQDVSGFDENLGPGALGFGDDTLFSLQLLANNYSIVGIKDAIVEHHCGLSRISKSSYFLSAEKMGRSEAYIAYHWHLADVAPIKNRLRLKKLKFMSALGKNCDSVEGQGGKGCLSRVMYQSFLEYLLECRASPRRYASQSQRLRAC